MGNSKSLPVDELVVGKDIDVTEHWIQKCASFQQKEISLFEQNSDADNARIFQAFSRNLMLNRHPYILKYVSSWRNKKKLFVATESAVPLVHVLDTLMPMQICVGLYNVAVAIVFLHKNASSSYNALSLEAIYVTDHGVWKIGQLQEMTRISQSDDLDSNNHQTLVDQMSFASIALEVLKKAKNDEIPALTEFREFCAKHATANVNHRFFDELLAHPFFTHRYVEIYHYLSELPLKSEEEKLTFFETLADDLTLFTEEVVARQFSMLILSRLVLLNESAQKYLLPRIFTVKNDHNDALFTMFTLQKYFVPPLLMLFSIRDSQIRLILLRFFPSFSHLFTAEQLKKNILPELLVGIKDKNDVLVSTTLHTLADLVPVMSAAVVIGNERAKLFADGRPLIGREVSDPGIPEVKLTENESKATPNHPYVFVERLSPDGGEDVNAVETIAESNNIESSSKGNSWNNEDVTVPVLEESNAKIILKKDNLSRCPPAFVDEKELFTLDVKCSRSKNNSAMDDIDSLFKDMEPVISKPKTMNVTDVSHANPTNKFQAVNDEVDDRGWDDEVAVWE